MIVMLFVLFNLVVCVTLYLLSKEVKHRYSKIEFYLVYIPGALYVTNYGFLWTMDKVGLL